MLDKEKQKIKKAREAAGEDVDAEVDISQGKSEQSHMYTYIH